ncbi:MAG: DUF1232 domain-containing protein [Actinobacteria bacterium]|nr:DUF1232 domain-containing protein [Actinomycetota bacterium]
MSDTLYPDEVIGPDGARSGGAHRPLKEAMLALPNMVKLVGRLVRDPRVPARSKAFAILAAGYVLSPIDLVPDFIPFLGQSDDALVVILALHRLIRSAGEDIVLEHWDGSQDVLAIVENVVDLAAGLVPARLSWLARRLG